VETPLRFRRLDRIVLLGFEVPVATTRLSRLLGLALLPRERAGAGLLIPRCRSVHTLGMRFPLDLLFLDRGGRVVEVRRDVSTARVVRCRGADAVLELPSPQAASPNAGLDLKLT
jgi:uncharacterized membrane protein (UPF0127 family)